MLSDSRDEFAERMIGWYERVARYRALSRLFGDTDGSGPLAALAKSIEEQIHNVNELTARVHDHWLRIQVLAAEIDTVVVQAKTASMMELTPVGRRSFSVEDLREESRLILEEAEMSVEIAEKRALITRGTALLQIADVMTHRDGSRRDDGLGPARPEAQRNGRSDSGP